MTDKSIEDALRMQLHQLNVEYPRLEEQCRGYRDSLIQIQAERDSLKRERNLLRAELDVLKAEMRLQKARVKLQAVKR